MRALYPGNGGFNWRLGETVGAQIVSVPFEVQTRRANAAFKDFLIALAGAFALLFVALNVLLSRMVLGPLNLANAALDRLADTDALTGAHNRRSFDRRLQEAISAARRGKRPLSLIALDIDHFKQSTTASATRPATTCSSRPARPWTSGCASTIRWRAWAARSSS